MSKTNNASGGASTKDKYPHSLTASSVSEAFYDAVRTSARKQSLTLQTFARWCVELALGRNPAKPLAEVGGTYSLGTNIDGPTEKALVDALKGKGPDGTDYPKAQWLREVLAKASGYDLSLEPVSASPGEAAKKRAERNQTRDSLMAELWATNPDMVRRTAANLGVTLRSMGIYDEQEEEESAQEQPEPATV